MFLRWCNLKQLVGCVILLTTISAITTIAEENRTHTTSNLPLLHGTKLVIPKPTGFQIASSYSGYAYPATGASILATEIPAPFSKIIQAFNKETMKARAMELVNREQTTVCNYPALIINFHQNALGKSYQKCSVVFGDEKETVMITGTAPETTDKQVIAAMKKAMLQTQWLRGKKTDQFTDLTYSVNSNALRFAKRIGNSLVFTASGNAPISSNDTPLMAFAPSLNEALQISDKQQFCRDLLERNAKYTSVQIQKQAPIKIDNMSGYETIATATHRGKRVFVYLIIVFYDRSFYQGEGLVTADKQAEYEPIFRKMAMSLKRKTPNLN